MANRTFKKKEQEGAALLALLAMVVVGGTGALLGMVNQINHTAKRNTHDAVTLAKAKEALIAYGVKYASAPPVPDQQWSARLPCPAPKPLPPPPDDPGGVGATSCDTPIPPIGRLPWVDLGLDELRDSAGEPLWYAVSRTFRVNPDNPSLSPVNTGTPGGLTVTNGPSGDVVAVVFAPGKALESQDRSTDDVTNYLEGSNSDKNTSFEIAPVSDTFNDVVLAITQSELMTAVERLPGLNKSPGTNSPLPADCVAPFHILECVRYAIETFVQEKGFYPNASSLGEDGTCSSEIYGNLGSASCELTFPTWFNYNKWYEVIYYEVDGTCDNVITSCSGNIAVGALPGHKAVAFYAGRPLTGSRPSASSGDYLEYIRTPSLPVTTPPIVYSAPTISNDAFINFDIVPTTSTTTSTVTTTTATTTTTSINMNQPNTIEGGSGDDIIYSGNQGDVVYGNAGNDQIFGGNGNDIIYGGTGSDQLDGENGSDIIYGGAGSDQIYGGNGSDTIYGGADDDQMYGGNGDDTFMIEPDSGQDTIEGGGGNNDTINLTLALLTGNPGVGNWTMKINGSFINNVNTPYSVPNEATGFISINNGASTITFIGVEKIVW